MYSIIAAILIVVVLSPGTFSAQRQWGLEIELSKDHYVSHEPIWLDITLTNTGTDTQRTDGLMYPNYSEFTIGLKDSLGNAMEYTWVQHSVLEHLGRLLLGPGEQDFGSFDLARLFEPREGNSGYAVSQHFPFIPKSGYTVQVYFEDAVSNELTFTVVEPSGDEQEVLELIERARSVWRQKNTDPSARIYREAVERFPNSVFAERCYYRSEVYSMEAREERTRGPWTLDPVKRKTLVHYPNSGDARAWIVAITSEMDEKAKRDFLDSLVQAYPNTRAAKYIKVEQNRMNKQKAEK